MNKSEFILFVLLIIYLNLVYLIDVQIIFFPNKGKNSLFIFNLFYTSIFFLLKYCSKIINC